MSIGSTICTFALKPTAADSGTERGQTNNNCPRLATISYTEYIYILFYFHAYYCCKDVELSRHPSFSALIYPIKARIQFAWQPFLKWQGQLIYK